MNITAEMLESKGACVDQVSTFRAEWPDGAEVTETTCFRAVELGLDFDWASLNLLTCPALAEYNRLNALAFCAAWTLMQEEAVPEGMQ